MGGDEVEMILPVGIISVAVIGLLTTLRPTITMKNKVISGEPFANIVYTDEKGGTLLVAEDLDLQGKPDYIFRKWSNGNYIPFEIKSTQLKEDEPHEGDMMQLVAYFLLIEEVYGKKPPYGRLIYKNKSFKIRNTRSLRRHLQGILNEMHQMLEGNITIKAEPSFVKCKNCICRQTVCEWSGED